MLENHPRVQLCFIIEKYGRSVIDDSRRCKGLLKDLAPQHQLETNLLMLVLDQQIVVELMNHNNLVPLSLQINTLAQRLHDNVGVQKEFALWAVESWALALNMAITPTQNAKPSHTNNTAINTNTVEDALGMEFVKIPKGSFMMGSPENEVGRYWDEKLHKVNIAHDFYLSKHLVTQAQWQAIMGSNPSCFKGDNLPVEQVSWLDVQTFIALLNHKTGQNYRLPTEAEWEYACRAGTNTPFYTGHVMTNKDANFYRGFFQKNATTPVGSYPANPWGLYDMLGNLWELTASAYDDDYKFSEQCASNNDVNTPVLRGGSFTDARRRSAHRTNVEPDKGYSFVGFRLALGQTA